jgi:hypothetical protein
MTREGPASHCCAAVVLLKRTGQADVGVRRRASRACCGVEHDIRQRVSASRAVPTLRGRRLRRLGSKVP